MGAARGGLATLALVGLAAGCIGGTKTDTTPTGHTGDPDTCETVPDRSCGAGAPSTGDTGCPEGYSCSGPSVYVCYTGNCDLPECLPPTAEVDTPSGPVPVRDLRVGDLVWTLASDGSTVVPAPVVRLGSVRAPVDHVLAEITLDDGRTVRASPRHPTADGRRLRDLRPGDALDGATVVAVDAVELHGPRTYDLLPDGASGVVWVDGVALGSTLASRPRGEVETE